MKRILFDVENEGTEKARQRGRDIATRFDIGTTLPVKLAKICHFCGISVTTRDSATIWGALMWFQEKKIVQISQNIDRGWQRFVLAHEIGHFTLHKKRLAFMTVEINALNDDDIQAEAEANAFAEELLLPARAFIPLSRIADTSVLAGYFGVSSDLVTHRAKTLNIER